MDKPKVNLLINVLMFFCVTAITGIGLLMKYILLPGKETWVVYGRKVELFFLGKDRHVWSTIHLVIAFVFLGLLMLHIVLHWKPLLVSYRRFIGNRAAQTIMGAIIAIAGVFLVVFPLAVKPEVREPERKGSHQHKSNDYKEKDSNKKTW